MLLFLLFFYLSFCTQHCLSIGFVLLIASGSFVQRFLFCFVLLLCDFFSLLDISSFRAFYYVRLFSPSLVQVVCVTVYVGWFLSVHSISFYLVSKCRIYEISSITENLSNEREDDSKVHSSILMVFLNYVNLFVIFPVVCVTKIRFDFMSKNPIFNKAFGKLV